MNPVLQIESLPARETQVGGMRILRALPRSRRRMVGPWCFLDRYGPISFTREKAMDVGAHPHMGLQTVSWLLKGEVVHHDSLGCEAVMHAGQLNLMTSGAGIAHAEETPSENSGELSGVQLWIALPDGHRNMTPVFDHYPVLPSASLPAATATVIVGEMMGATSPARMFSPVIGADIEFQSDQPVAVPLQRDFEHALLVLKGDVAIQGRRLDRGALHYVGLGHDELEVSSHRDSRLLLIGGRPFGEHILMWWNFVARTEDEIAQAREDWVNHRRFGDVHGYAGSRLASPEFINAVPPNPAR